MVCCNLLTIMHLTSFSTIKIKIKPASFGFEKIQYISEMFESINMHISPKLNMLKATINCFKTISCIGYFNLVL